MPQQPPPAPRTLMCPYPRCMTELSVSSEYKPGDRVRCSNPNCRGWLIVQADRLEPA